MISNLLKASLGFALLLGVSTAPAITITSGFSGAWFDPEHPGQGLQIIVVADDEGNRATVFMGTFDADGNQVLLGGNALVQKNRADMVLFTPRLGEVRPDGSADEPEYVPWGNLALEFDDCGAGTAELTQLADTKLEKIRVGTGTFRLQRLTQVKSLACTGGISDDLPQGLPSQQIEINVGGDQAFGTARLIETERSAQFEIGLRDAQPGTYEVLLDDELSGTIVVDEDGTGALRFSSPTKPGQPLLDFDPRGASVKIRVGTGTVLSDTRFPKTAEIIPTQPPIEGDGRSIEVVADLAAEDAPLPGDPMGQLRAIAALDAATEQQSLTLELIGAPTGLYDAFLDGERVASAMVMPSADGPTFGRAELRFPPTVGFETLDFDPRGETIEWRQRNNILVGEEAAAIFELQFPQ